MNRNLQHHLIKAVTIAVMACSALNADAGSKSDPYVFQPERGKGPILIAQAFADRDAIVPGKTLKVLISIKLSDDWHVYWRNPGSTGLPTQVTWTAPKGFRFGRTQFPAPSVLFDKELGEAMFVLGEEPLLLADVEAPADLKIGETITLKAHVSWLACKGACIPGQTDPDLTLTLPVVSDASKAHPANIKLFDEAVESYPVPAARAEHIKISSATEPGAAKPGAEFSAVLTVDIAPGMHMQSHKPNQDYLIPAQLFVEPTDGFEFDEPAYPPAHEREDRSTGKVEKYSEYVGKIQFRIPVEVDKEAGKEPRWIRGVFQYQICTEKGECFRPQYVAFEIPVRMEGGSAATTPPVWLTTEPEPADTSAHQAENASSSETGKPNAPVFTQSGEPAGSNENAFLSLLNRLQNWLLEFGYGGALAVAFIGGVIMNLMPCVLPVLSLKILSFVRQANEHRARVFWLGAVYSLGIMTFFGFVAVLFYLTGDGWGQLFQKPMIVIGVAAVVTAFAMSLFGLFTIFTPVVISKLDEKVEGEGYLSAYVTGILATFLGAACTGPFLSAALGAATRFGPALGAGIFVTAGIGMAFPFLLLAANPGWLRYVPKPGKWMHNFEVLMGFLLLITVVWLLNPLRGQIGDFGVLLSVFFLLMVSLAMWVKGKVQWGDARPRKWALNALALSIIIVGWMIPFQAFSTIDALTRRKIMDDRLLADGQYYQKHREEIDECACVSDAIKIVWPADGSIPWEHYDRDRAMAAVRAGYTVFIDYTADWCVNCKVNLRTSIEHQEVIAVMREMNVIPYEADYTKEVPEIKEDLKRFERGGVPMYLVFSPGDPNHPQVLPELLTPGTVIDALRKAGPSQVASSR